MLVKGFFFDLFGTLLIPKNSKKAWNNWFKTFYKLMRSYGLNLSKKKFANASKDFFINRETENNNSKLTAYENKIDKFALDLNLKLEVEKIKKIQQATINAWQKYLKIDPQTIPLLEILKNKKHLALITNFDHPPHVYSILSKYKLTEYFEFIAISGEIGFEKPDPRIFHITLKNIGLKPDEVIFIGDSNEDVNGAISAGIKPILIQQKISKQSLTKNDYYSKNGSENLNTHNSYISPWKIISNLRELYEIFDL
ncbi:MAG: HAD family hydrolase [Promethearchaeota archaeon]